MRRLRDESGIAIQLVMGVLALLAILSAAVVAASVQLTGTANEDRNSKRAFGAAEAGLQTALYRMNKLLPPLDAEAGAVSLLKCVTATLTDVLPGGACPGQTESLGNNASYTYYVTPILSVGGRCAGLTLSDPQNTLLQRCVTSTGTVNGVKRRVQIRTAAFRGLPIFALPGIIGTAGVTVGNSANIGATIGSNGNVAIGTSGTVGPITLGTGASVTGNPTFGNSTSHGAITQRPPTQGNFVLAPVEIGSSATVNDNVRITNGLLPTCVTLCDTSRNVSYNAVTRELAIGSNGVLTIGGGATGQYNFCSINMGNNSKLLLAPNAQVRVFIDSPYRAGSLCRLPAANPDAGTIVSGNNVRFTNPTLNPKNFQLYVYGWQYPGTGTAPSALSFRNSDLSYITLYAPDTDLNVANAADFHGAIAGRTVTVANGSNFVWDARVADLTAKTLPVYTRTAWHECKQVATPANDPQSAC